MGLKGSDGMVEEALRRGAVAQSGNRTRVALRELLDEKDNIVIYTGPGEMGENAAPELTKKTALSLSQTMWQIP